MAKSTSVLFVPTTGELVNYNGLEYVILKIVSLSEVLARNITSKEMEVLKISDLKPWTVKSDTEEDKAVKELPGVPAEDWELARARLKLIEPLLKRKVRGKAAAEQIAAQADCGIATVYRWVRKFRDTGLLSSLLQDKPGRRVGTFRLDAEVEKIIEDRIKNYHLTDQQPSVASTTEKIQTLCANAGLPKPHWETVNRRILAIDERERYAKRRGERAASQLFDPIDGTVPNAEWPLALVQMDHTKLPVMIVHDVTRTAIGRPWLSLSIDVYSRVAPGMEYSLEPPSASAAGLCLAHSILPKEKWLAEDIGLRNVEWPIWGVMGIVHMDNAKEFRGNMIKDACLEYNIDPQFRPVKQPHYGGHIERMMGTLSEMLKTLDGATFANPVQKGEYDSEVKATMTFDELEKWLVLCLAKYHNSPHKGINDETPLDRYRKGLLGGDGKLPRGLPARRLDEEKVRIDFMPTIERTVQNYGVVIDDAEYFADVLRPWIMAPDPDHPKSTRLFKFKRDPHDISVLYFLEPNAKRYYPVPFKDSSLPPITLWEYNAARKAAKKAGIKNLDARKIIEYSNMQQQIQDQAAKDTKAARQRDQRKRNATKARKKIDKQLPKTRASLKPSAPPPVIQGYDQNRKSHFDDDE